MVACTFARHEPQLFSVVFALLPAHLSRQLSCFLLLPLSDIDYEQTTSVCIPLYTG